MVFIPPGKDLALAAEELRFLLGRGYPRERCLVLVGDRRAMGREERELLRRAVLDPALAAARRAKLARFTEAAGERLGIDGHNVLITLESALAGRELVRGDDGAIRDIARIGGSFRPTDLTRQALALILRTLAHLGVGRTDFFLDRPLSRSGELAARIRVGLEETGLAGTAQAVPVPERELKPYQGLVAGSDGDLIDACARPLDLAGAVIGENLEEVRIIDFASG